MGVPANITLFILVCAVTLSSSSALDRPPLTAYAEFVRMSCDATKYPTLCFSALSGCTSFIRTSPRNMAMAALNVTLVKARLTSAFVEGMSRARSLNPREAGALRDCVELIHSATDEIKGSLSELRTINGSSFERVISDVQTWVSAVLTDEDTCLEGFSGKGMDGEVKRQVSARVGTLARTTSVALALINRYASVHG
ncbi:hypothetical protein MLD38_029093 [Melastoma candidum]|uniref:Uncharacterized protein n=1 Tax=Melastoma candidum TaxID=119954 RepID=A0ACB9N327_9MYRT|nr:hypothetical protein MLD38_029093 [Melastoma candidum]